MVKNALYENGVREIFRLKVVQGKYAGIYDIKKPDKFDDVDCIVDIDPEKFNVNNFILGDTSKIKFIEYYDPETFELIKNVYEEQAGDAEVIFIWQYEKEGEVFDVLEENYSLNLNKYKQTYEASRKAIENEVKKRDSQNLLLTREDTSVNLFSTKNLDSNDITTVPTTEIYYKEGGRTYTNFYFASVEYEFISTSWKLAYRWFPPFSRSSDRDKKEEFGENENLDVGTIRPYPTMNSIYLGDPLYIVSSITNLRIEFSNFKIATINDTATDPDSETCPFSLLVEKIQDGNVYERTILKDSEYNETSHQWEIAIENESFECGSVKENSRVRFWFWINGHDGNSGPESVFQWETENASFELKTELIAPLRRSKSVLLKDAINQFCKQYTTNSITLQSSLIDNGGKYEKTAISTGLFLRGISSLYLVNEKLTTSLKDLLYESAMPLIGLGFDLIKNKIVVEDIEWFFKDLQCYDLTSKSFLRDNFSIENDSEIIYNNLVFGTKKYSTNNKDDLSNFNTSMEVSTPIKSIKNKFDKTANCIIDNKKIQELILDNSNSTNDNDDDVVLIDLVELESYTDEGVLVNCIHKYDNGYLWLTCTQFPFDTLAIDVGSVLIITSGINIGSWTILEINKSRCKLNKTSGIQEGQADTNIKFTVYDLIKNRTNEGFSSLLGVDDVNAVTNVRHNPKYQMARWFPFFGGGMVAKLDNENLVVSKYKNNGGVTVNWNSTDLDNELPGLTTLDQNEVLGRLRSYKTPFFNGKKIEVTLTEVTFNEFFQLYKNWRYGINDDYTKSRGYITINIEGVNMNIYPFGEGGISFDRKLNQLTLKGKIKNIYYNDMPFKYFDRYFDYFFE